jgi:hypothetical protein
MTDLETENMQVTANSCNAIQRGTEEKHIEEGCYLVYSSDSGGKLTLHYSRTRIPEAIGFWRPGFGPSVKKIPDFKFAQNAGRVELIKGIAGSTSNRKKYFNGWCQFVKAAKAYDGVLYKWDNNGGIEVDFWTYQNTNNSIVKVGEEDVQATGHCIDVSRVDAIGCVPKNSAFLLGVKTIDVGIFLRKANDLGASVSM